MKLKTWVEKTLISVNIILGVFLISIDDFSFSLGSLVFFAAAIGILYFNGKVLSEYGRQNDSCFLH